MQQRIGALLAAIPLAAALAGCAALDDTIRGAVDRIGWTTLIDGGNGLGNFERVGDADWVSAEGTVMAQAGKQPGYLVTRTSYRDFTLRAEFWASDDANSGIYFRCQEPTRITDENCYEANIFDQRPDPSYGTGAIVKVSRIQPMPKAGGKWNTYEVTARGPHLVVLLNGVKTADVHDPRLVRGPVALQWARGTIKWRKLEIKPL